MILDILLWGRAKKSLFLARGSGFVAIDRTVLGFAPRHG
jgi:hypothetical protein